MCTPDRTFLAFPHPGIKMCAVVVTQARGRRKFNATRKFTPAAPALYPQLLCLRRRYPLFRRSTAPPLHPRFRLSPPHPPPHHPPPPHPPTPDPQSGGAVVLSTSSRRSEGVGEMATPVRYPTDREAGAGSGSDTVACLVSTCINPTHTSPAHLTRTHACIPTPSFYGGAGGPHR